MIPKDLEKLEFAPKFKESKSKIKKQNKKISSETAGAGWYHMPAIKETEEIKRDLALLRMRGSADLKTHYKKIDWKNKPKFIQMGTVVKSSFDRSSDLTRKQTRGTLIEQLLDNDQARKKIRSKYLEIQKKRASVKKFGYNKFKKSLKSTKKK
ncbi:hypothetical protein HZS_5360 [Henneguya salminicola]|nr:hypothetical protein HZS_5360 [Henneguya salminicola]